MTLLGVAPQLEINVILSGFAMFIIGINILGDGLTEAAGPRINEYIEKYTSNLFMAMLVGTIITAIMNSSTAATVISISLVRAGLMSLEQAIGISVGANLGTTMTSLIIGLNIEELGHYILFVGVVIILLAKRKQLKNWGHVLFGFGLLFVGLDLMSQKLLVIEQFDVFQESMYALKDHPWLALGGSTIATAVINSSTAVIGIVQKLFSTGEMDMIVASAFVFGSNVGTTLTAVIVSVGGSVATRRAGWFHALYNVIGALIGMIIIVPYSNLITAMNAYLNGTPEMSIGLNHLVFNLASMILVIPFIPATIRLLKILIPGEDRVKTRGKIEPLDENLIEVFPEAALQLAKKSTLQMADLVIESIETSQRYLHSRDEEDYEVVNQLEGMVNKLDTEITSYLLKIAKSGMQNETIAETYTKTLEIVKNYERISDLSTNIVGFYKLVFEEREYFSDEGSNDLDTMYQLISSMLNRSLKIYKNDDLTKYDALIQDEEYLDLIEAKYREKHFQRMAEGIETTKVASTVYVDILSTLERIGDHGVNVARNVHSAIKFHENEL